MYIELRRPTKLAFTWMASVNEEGNPPKVTVRLQPDSIGCLVSIIHSRGAAAKIVSYSMKNGWYGILKQLEQHLNGKQVHASIGRSKSRQA